jgi:hypothetical protein
LGGEAWWALRAVFACIAFLAPSRLYQLPIPAGTATATATATDKDAKARGRENNANTTR